ncbi:MAG: hypothetical protein SOW08_06550 [Lachnospiraceae bacterium]|nr:hypothetical protein [Lachnospiraceae bacterium]
MKRKLLCIVMVGMVLMFGGCSSAEKGESSAPADSQSTVSDAMNQTETEEQSKEEGTDKNDTEEETKQVSLNVENDTFSFDALIQQIGAGEDEAVKVLGAKEKSDSYKTELFGEPVVITLSTNDDTISGIHLAFENTDEELLTNAIAEQLGSDGESGEKTVTWKLDSCTVELQQTEKGCDVEISAKE